MTDLYLTEYGKRILIDVGYDVSSATLVRVLFSASAGTVSATCSILGANYTTSCGSIFSAERAVEYVVASGDFSATGADNYRGWVEVTFPSAKLISDSFEFIVTTPGD